MKTNVYIGTSLDGFIARKDGDIDWLVKFADQEVTRSYEEFISSIDAIVIGRGTYEKVLSLPAWPYDKKVFILSTFINQLPDIIKGKATVLSMQPKNLLGYLSGEGFSNIYIDGGKVIQSFLKEDLIDELIISKVPVLIGNGIPLFDNIEIDLPFKHVRTNTFTNGLVMSYYERNRNG